MMPETTWVWIEIPDRISLVAPSPRLAFGLQNQRQVYTLQAEIYLGGDHFTARLLDQSAHGGNTRLGVQRDHYDHTQLPRFRHALPLNV